MEESVVTPLLGLIGLEVAGNPTQFAIERVLQAAKLEWRFLSFAVAPDRLGDVVRGLDALNFRGLAVAPSCSELIFPLLGQHDLSSEVSRWVDAISRSSTGTLIGHNLIAQSLVDFIRQAEVTNERLDEQSEEPVAHQDESTDQPAKTAIVLGNTGKGLAMARLLLANKFSSVLFRDHHPAPEETGFLRSNLRGNELANTSMLIRASVSDDDPQVAEISEAQLKLLPSSCLVVDLATSAGTSPMLRFAQSQGLKTLSLIDLMVVRATRAFQLWTDTDPDVNLLREAFEEYLEI